MKEIWKDIQGYKGLYQVSNYGNVKSLNYRMTGKERILRTSRNNKGYKSIKLSKDGKSKRFSIHRLVAMHFIPNPENKSEVNHIDGNKQNNQVNNLEWCTGSENKKHAFKTGLIDKRILIEANKSGNNPKARKVVCINNNKEFDCINDASKWCGLTEGTSITRCCKGKRKTAGKDPVTKEKLQWKYVE